MGEAKWFQPTVRNRLSQAIVLANFSVKCGKFYDVGNPFRETMSAQGTKIVSKAMFEWGVCGRERSPSGTEGRFEIHLAGTDEKIAEIYWECPWGSCANVLDKVYTKPGFIIAIDGFSLYSACCPLNKGAISVLED